MIDDELEQCLRAELGHTVSPEQLPALANRVANRLRAKWGGERIYIGKRRQIIQRNQLIRASFTGNNVPDLCLRYQLSRRQIYRIIGKK